MSQAYSEAFGLASCGSFSWSRFIARAKFRRVTKIEVNNLPWPQIDQTSEADFAKSTGGEMTCFGKPTSGVQRTILKP